MAVYCAGRLEPVRSPRRIGAWPLVVRGDDDYGFGLPQATGSGSDGGALSNPSSRVDLSEQQANQHFPGSPRPDGWGGSDRRGTRHSAFEAAACALCPRRTPDAGTVTIGWRDRVARRRPAPAACSARQSVRLAHFGEQAGLRALPVCAEKQQPFRTEVLAKARFPDV